MLFKMTFLEKVVYYSCFATVMLGLAAGLIIGSSATPTVSFVLIGGMAMCVVNQLWILLRSHDRAIGLRRILGGEGERRG